MPPTQKAWGWRKARITWVLSPFSFVRTLLSSSVVCLQGRNGHGSRNSQNCSRSYATLLQLTWKGAHHWGNKEELNTGYLKVGLSRSSRRLLLYIELNVQLTSVPTVWKHALLRIHVPLLEYLSRNSCSLKCESRFRYDCVLTVWSISGVSGRHNARLWILCAGDLSMHVMVKWNTALISLISFWLVSLFCLAVFWSRAVDYQTSCTTWIRNI